MVVFRYSRGVKTSSTFPAPFFPFTNFPSHIIQGNIMNYQENAPVLCSLENDDRQN